MGRVKSNWAEWASGKIEEEGEEEEPWLRLETRLTISPKWNGRGREGNIMFPHDVLSGISTLNYESPVSRCLCAQREIPWQRRPLHFFFCLPPFFFFFFFLFWVALSTNAHRWFVFLFSRWQECWYWPNLLSPMMEWIPGCGAAASQVGSFCRPCGGAFHRRFAW